MDNIPLTVIRPNPYRNLDLYPLDRVQVAKLAESMKTNGDPWPGIIGRRVGDAVEIAFGHHRLEAARNLGVTHLPVEIRPLTDMMMAVMLAAENGTQRDSGLAPCLDAVAGMSMVLAEELMETGRGTPTSHSKGQAKRAMQNGNGIGWRQIMQQLPKGLYSRNQVNESLSLLKRSGRMARIITEARDRAEAEAAPDPVTAAQNERAVRKAAAAPVEFDARCAQVFVTGGHLRAFRDVVTGETVKPYLPVEQQFEFAKAVMQELRDLEHRPEITAMMIRDHVWTRIHSGTGIPRSKLRTAKERPSVQRITDGLNHIRRAVGDFKKGIGMLASALEEEEMPTDRQWERLEKFETVFLAGVSKMREARRPKLRVVKGGKR